MKKILAAMSGGVDSAVTVGLLREAGCDVAGATMLLHDGGEAEAESAREAAERLGVPFTVFDWRGEFRRSVIDPFTAVYRAGGTPNPCIFCNRALKFGKFLDEALRLGFDGMATGHYARVAYDGAAGIWRLFAAADPAKDQSYMLCALTQERLARVELPLGALTKDRVRALAAAWGLPQASRRDSQDICFVPDGDYMAYLAAHGCPPTPGRFLAPDGRDLGPHRGFEGYTIGQRRGLEIAAGRRVYVVAKRRPDVVLGEADALLARRVRVRDMRWIAGTAPGAPLRAAGKLRYTAAAAPCLAEPEGDGVLLVFDTPQRAVTPGQTAVLYRDGEVLGGGAIESAEA